MTDREEGASAQARMAQLHVETKLLRAHVYAALAAVVISALFGLIVAIKFNSPTFLGETAELTWGRVRYAHTQGIFFGW